MTLFVGLGNPTATYEDNRHNIGFKVIDNLINNFKARDVSKNSFLGTLHKSNDLLFLKPTTYMNLSGKSLIAVKNFYKIDIKNIIVIHDDLDLPFGAVRFKNGGGNGGHNGLKSIDSVIGKEYIRVRMGIGKPEYRSQVADFVLSDFSQEEHKDLDKWIEHTTIASKLIINENLEKIKSRYTLKDIKVLSK
jgi:PTH1 family peptidyl-tRNA hydrolase